MKIVKDEHTGDRHLEFSLGADRPGSLAHFINEWEQLLNRGEYNWSTYHLINFEFEDDSMLGAFEFQIVLLGFGIRVRLGLKNTPQLEELQQRVKEIESLPHADECNCPICEVL